MLSRRIIMCLQRAFLFVLPLLCLAANPAHADRSERTEAGAETAFTAGDWTQAEKLYQQALSETQFPDVQRRCYRRLVEIAYRSAAYGKAIEYGENYQKLLTGPEHRKDLAELSLHLGECYYALGQYRPAEVQIDKALAVNRTLPLSPPLQIAAVSLGYRIADKYRNEDRINEYVRELKRLRDLLINDRQATITARERIEAARKLSTAYEHRRLYQDGVDLLMPMLAVHDTLGDDSGKWRTLEQLGRLQAALGKHPQAQEQFRQALTSLTKVAPDDARGRGDLQAALAISLEATGDTPQAQNLSREAAASYQQVLDAKEVTEESAIDKIDAFWKLQALWQRTEDFRSAIQLAENRGEDWQGHGWMEPRVKSELGSLQFALGEVNKAAAPLAHGVSVLQGQSPLNLAALTLGLNSLALVKMSSGELADAEKLVQECVDLYQTHDLPLDRTRAECANLLGSIATARGDYAVAIDSYRDGVELAGKLQAEGHPLRCRMLLNMAQVYRSQGNLAEATQRCNDAWSSFREFAPEDSFGNVAFACALAGMEAAQGHFSESRKHASDTLRRLKEKKIESGMIWMAATHCLALDDLSRRETAKAEQAWKTILADQTGFAKARTLNYLGIAAETRKDFATAATYYEDARKLQDNLAQAAPVTHFITLWRSALLADRDGRRRDAMGRLEQAIDVVEKARVRTYGASDERATYFAQFQPAFDQLIDWYVQCGEVDKAFVTLERSRSRTFLDQFQLTGADPRQSLQGERGDQLRRQEGSLRERLSSLRARAHLLAARGSNDEAARLLGELEVVQREFSGVWREIYAANPMYRNLVADSANNSLADLRKQVLESGSVLVAYHLGREKSHLLMVGSQPGDSQAVELEIPRWVVASLAKEPTESNALQVAGTRGFLLQARNDLKSPLNAPSSEQGSIPLTRELSRHVVDFWRQRVEGPASATSRGLQLLPKEGSPVAVSMTGTDALTEVLLPTKIRKAIADRKAEFLVVIPDGPLHKLPLEALVIRHATRPVYALEELPPIVYAPSAAALAAIVDRGVPVGELEQNLLTVGNPTYPQEAVAVANVEPITVASRAAVDLHSLLPPLPYTANECHRIEKLFNPQDVVLLEGSTASEENVVAAIRGKRVVHLAAHGFSDDRFGNMFGALALTPPTADDPKADGFLSLYEIAELPLDECQLAVLSACVTNVGPQRPLEAGVTLASGFLMAGARRVVASHWSVDDRSTAELMGSFLDGVRNSESAGNVVNYAKALRDARLKIRNTPEWGAPRYWAPFVLLGPAEDREIAHGTDPKVETGPANKGAR